MVDALYETFAAGGASFPELLLSCLEAAQAAGGDRRGQQSAALLVVRAGGGYLGMDDRWIDLRVDEHEMPIRELGRLLALHHLYGDRPTPDELLPLDESTAAEVRALLGHLDATPDHGSRFRELDQPDGFATLGIEVVGEARSLPQNWNDACQRALYDWMAIENLEGRFAAAGWIDRRALELLRQKGAASA